MTAIIGRTAVLVAAATVAIIIPSPAGAEDEAPADLLYVTNGALDQEPPNQHPTVARFTVESTGRVTQAGIQPAGADARGIVFTPRDAYGRRFAYVSSLSAGTDGAINRYSVAANGTLSPLPEDQETAEPFGIAISPDGRTVYVANFDIGDGQGAVSAFRVESNGWLTPMGTRPTGEQHAKGVAITPDGRHLYVSNGAPPDGRGTIVGFPVNADGTVGERVARADVGPSGHRVVITPDGRFAYVTSQNAEPGPDVFGFRIGIGGTLTPVGSFDAGTWVEGAAISPDGKRLYVTALETVGLEAGKDGDIRGFAIGAGGGLTEIARLEDTRFDPVDLAFGSDGRHLYVADFAVSTVTVLAVDSAGALRPTQTVASGGQNPGFQSVFVPRG